MISKRTIISIPVFLVAGVLPAFADSITPFLGVSSSTANNYYFDNTGLNLSLTSNGSQSSNPGGYTLTASGSGAFTFNAPSPGFHDAGTATNYQLVANFTASGAFIANGSLMSIYGTLSSLPNGAQPFRSDNLLLSANLTAFGYNANQADIGFITQFLPSWANQPLFTGGSAVESVYLFDQTGLTTGTGVLSNLIAAMQANNLGSVAGLNYAPVESVAIVPLPLPAILFAAGLTPIAVLSRSKKRGAA